MNFYNEFDRHAAEWLRNLIAEGLIAEGIVDERPIQEIKPDDLKGFTQCHFFAGIGGWSYALRLAGWSDDRPVWTGSCPCQSFSQAGKREGASSERHLWPEWFRLISQCSPPVIFGEQVASAISFGWLDAVATDLEAQDYAFGSSVLSGFTQGAYHKRQRLWFVAESPSARAWDGERGLWEGTQGISGEFVADSDSGRREERPGQRESVSGLVFGGAERLTASGIDDLADSEHDGRHRAQADTSLEGSDESGIGLPVGDGITCPPGQEIVADSEDNRLQGSEVFERKGSKNLENESQSQMERTTGRHGNDDECGDFNVADSSFERLPRRLRGRSDEERQTINGLPGRDSPVNSKEIELANPLFERSPGSGGLGEQGNPTPGGNREEYRVDDAGGECNPNWRAVEWIECQDGKARPIPLEPGLQPLVNGIPTVVDREGNPHKYSYTNALKGIGNAIIPQVAAEIITAYMEEKGYE